jgi:hypothetical protein
VVENLCNRGSNNTTENWVHLSSVGHSFLAVFILGLCFKRVVALNKNWGRLAWGTATRGAEHGDQPLFRDLRARKWFAQAACSNSKNCGPQLQELVKKVSNYMPLAGTRVYLDFCDTLVAENCERAGRGRPLLLQDTVTSVQGCTDHEAPHQNGAARFLSHLLHASRRNVGRLVHVSRRIVAARHGCLLPLCTQYSSHLSTCTQGPIEKRGSSVVPVQPLLMPPVTCVKEQHGTPATPVLALPHHTCCLSAPTRHATFCHGLQPLFVTKCTCGTIC